MQTNRKENRPVYIAMGWISLLLILAVGVMMLMMTSLVTHQTIMLERDPGVQGVAMITWLFALYAVMPVVVYGADRIDFKPLKWAVVVLTILLLVYFILHQLSHWRFGERPTLTSHALETSHHLVSLWIIYMSVKWALEKRPAAALQISASPDLAGAVLE